MAMNRNDMFYFILNHSQECIIRYDNHGCIEYCNDRLLELTGYSASHLIGTYIGEIVQNVFEVIDGKIGLMKEHVDKEIIETVIYRRNKTCFPVEVKVISCNTDNNVLNVCTAIDMTRYKESIRKVEESTQLLRKSMSERDSFVANVTHELRTPVNGIKGHAELMLEQESDFQKTGYLKLIIDCCHTMEGIINNILDFSKLEAGKFQLEEKEFSFYQFIDKIDKMFTLLTKRKGLRFMLNIGQGVPDKLIGDELRLTQVLNNLVSNAVKFTDQGYVGIEVSLNAKIDDEIELFFMVVDTGIGISREDKDKLFKSFSQVDASITRKYGGTGLGLSITKDLVNMMNGKIWADGEKGKGTSFSFTVRVKQKAGEETANIGMPEKVWQPSENKSRLEGEQDLMYDYGSEINIRELNRNFEKLNISMDMDNWQKAESIAQIIKQLLAGASREIQRTMFKAEMAIRKSDSVKAKENVKLVKEAIARELKGLGI